jgi:hypothetical protein
MIESEKKSTFDFYFFDVFFGFILLDFLSVKYLHISKYSLIYIFFKYGLELKLNLIFFIWIVKKNQLHCQLVMIPMM